MGSGVYSSATYSALYNDRGYKDARSEELFKNRGITFANDISNSNISARQYNKVNKEMQSIGVRECRDSQEHPNTTPIIIALDVTGSMGRIPDQLLRKGFPRLMNALLEVGIPDPQLLFMAIGDHKYDDAPIQVGQFESDTEKIVNMLQDFYIEGGGGGNFGESYLLAYLMAGYHTETDSWFKRHKKGYLFTMGDEPDHTRLESHYLKSLGYEDGIQEMSEKTLLEKAQEQYNVFHIHIKDGSYGIADSHWKDLLGDHLLTSHSSDVDKVIAKTIIEFMEKPQAEPETKFGASRPQVNLEIL